MGRVMESDNCRENECGKWRRTMVGVVEKVMKQITGQRNWNCNGIE